MCMNWGKVARWQQEVVSRTAERFAFALEVFSRVAAVTQETEFHHVAFHDLTPFSRVPEAGFSMASSLC